MYVLQWHSNYYDTVKFLLITQKSELTFFLLLAESLTYLKHFGNLLMTKNLQSWVVRPYWWCLLKLLLRCIHSPPPPPPPPPTPNDMQHWDVISMSFVLNRSHLVTYSTSIVWCNDKGDHFEIDGRYRGVILKAVRAQKRFVKCISEERGPFWKWYFNFLHITWF